MNNITIYPKGKELLIASWLARFFISCKIRLQISIVQVKLFTVSVNFVFRIELKVSFRGQGMYSILFQDIHLYLDFGGNENISQQFHYLLPVHLIKSASSFRNYNSRDSLQSCMGFHCLYS